MKLLYPEIDTCVYNTRKPDPSTNTLPLPLLQPGTLKVARVMCPPAQKAVTAWRGTNHGVFVPLLEVKQTSRFPFLMPFLQ